MRLDKMHGSTNPLHLRDDQLLLYAGREARELSADLVSHAESCSQCQTRLKELESAFGEFTESHQAALHATLPSAAGPRALLKAQLADLSAHQPSAHESALKPSKSNVASMATWRMGWRPAMVCAALAFAVIFVAFGRLHRILPARSLARVSLSNLSLSDLSLPDEPDARYTPGAVIAATRSQVCSASGDEYPAIPAPLKAKVLQIYGVASGRSDAYEVDYLITPELGGATDVRNLWPEPYDHTVWNAHVKDRLENRLRDMVCHGDIDLATAQRDISTDWIAAYRKYFHASKPLTGSS